MKKLKSMLAVALMICTLVAISVPAAAAKPTDLDYGSEFDLVSNKLTLKYNAVPVVFPDAQPFVDQNDRTLIPVRFVVETMGAKVTWNEKTCTAHIVKGNVSVDVAIGKKDIVVAKDGALTTVTMDTQAVLKNERTYVPIRFVAQELGAWVGFSDKYNTVQIYDDVLTPEEITRLHSYYDMTFEEWCKSNNENSGVSTDESLAKNYPMTTYCDGSRYGFANANEAKLRNPNGIETLTYTWKQPITYIGKNTENTYTFVKQSDVDFSKFILNEAKKGVEDIINAEKKVQVSFRSDLSCVYWSRHSTEVGACVRGVLSVTIPQDADITYIKQNYSHFIPNPVAGETQNIDVEVILDTFTENVNCDKISTLK